MIGWLARPWAMWALLGAAGALTAALAVAVWQTRVANAALAEAETTIAAQAEQIAGLERANRSQREAIAEYRIANRELTEAVDQAVALYEGEAQRNRVLATELESTRRALAVQREHTYRALDNLRRARESAYVSDADCRAWADAPVCGAVSRSVREHAEVPPAPR